MATLKKQDSENLDVYNMGENSSTQKTVLSHRNQYFQRSRERHEKLSIPPVANRPKPE